MVEYPRVLALANAEGEVFVELRIDTTGRLEPRSLRVLSDPLHDIALSAVRAAVQTWRWSPALRGGRRVPEVKQYRFTFHISRAAGPCPVSTVEHQVICFEEPPVHSASGVFRGYHTTGFESDRFVTCPDSFPTLLPELLPFRNGAHADANFTPAAQRSRPPVWPDIAHHDGPTITYFVVGRGTLRGPGSYGHLGAAKFVVVFDTVLSVHPPVPDACERFKAY